MILFVSGIDTGVGKTFATGMLARAYMARGRRVITQKLAQTGCAGLSEDILIHRRIMGTELYREDRDGLTCPYIFPLPASPHLAAREAGRVIDMEHLSRATDLLAERFDDVIVEGVGGLMVPLNEDVTVLDYVAERGYPVVLVSSPKLGSINHTLMSIACLKARSLPLWGVVYNLYAREREEIVADSREVFARALAREGFECPVVDLRAVPDSGRGDGDFSALVGG
jgi:dethiobiotin synthetase